ncbi:MAG: insulinase family protein [Isosphaeraceae bacterium]
MSGLDRASLVAFHSAFYRPEGSAWVLAGDFEVDAIARRLDDELAGWSGAPPIRPTPAKPAGLDRPRLVLLDRPGSAQAVIRAGHVGVPRLDPDYHAILILNQILGGQFTSRLNATLREEKGLTYGVRSHFDMRRDAGPFYVGASVQTDRVAEAVAELRAELEALAFGARPATAAELEDARRSLIEGQARHFETPSALVSRYAGLHLHGLPPDHLAGFADRLLEVEIEGLTSVASRRIHPDRLAIVVVADAESVAEPLRRLGWGPIDLIDDRA